MATATPPTIPVRLLDLGDDELECIVDGIQALEQDVVFVALACRRFLAAVRPVIRERDYACRKALHLLPASTVKLCTHVDGMFLSAARMQYCATHARSLGVTQAMGLVRPSLSPDNLPTGSLWHLIKAAPHQTIMDFYWYERENFGRTRFDMGLLENRALIMFAVAHGRMDVLYTLERGVPNQLDEVLFAPSAIMPMLGVTSVGPPCTKRHFHSLMTMLVRPAVRHCQHEVLAWIENRALRILHYKGIHAKTDVITFGGVRVHKDFFNIGWSPMAQDVAHQFGQLVEDAARAGNIPVFARALRGIKLMWAKQPASWISRFFMWMVGTVFAVRAGSGAVVRLILEWRNENVATVSAMGGFIPGHRLDLLDVTQMFDDDFVGPDTVFCLGDTDYYAWLLEESQTVPRGQSFLGRWVAEMGHEDDFSPSAPLATCDCLVACADRMRQHARGHASILEGLPRLVAEPAGRWGNRLSPETYAFYSPLAQRANALAPTRFELGIALVMEHWLHCILHGGHAMVYTPYGQNVILGVAMAGTAMLPVYKRLVARFADDKGALKELGFTILVHLEHALSSARGHCETFVVSLANFGYRHGLLKRSEIVQVFGDIALNDPHLLAEGKPVPQTIRAIGKQLGLLSPN
jgi:hypothetical protein